jgi:Fe2+ transport system protein FeoA
MNQPSDIQNLAGLATGEQAVVLNIQTPVDCACRLRSMGLCEGSSVCILHQQDPVIIQCEQTCMAVCRSLLNQIFVVHHSAEPDTETKNIQASPLPAVLSA